MRILLFGANGQVGQELHRSLAGLGEIVATTRSGKLDDGSACEVADFEHPAALAAMIQEVAPGLVVNAAAYTAVDRAEDEPEAAFRANAEAPAVMAAACAARDALLVHYSTDYVFDGTGTRPYREDDPTAPLGVYGASKLAGEEAIRASGARHMIFRTAWVYAAHGKNFLRTMLRLAAERDELRVVSDQVGTPTPASLIADVTALALRRPDRASGLWHLTASGSTSWHGFAAQIVDQAVALGVLANRPAVIPIQAHEFPTRALRPAYSCLDTARLQRDFDFPVPLPWQDGLARVLTDVAEAAMLR